MECSPFTTAVNVDHIQYEEEEEEEEEEIK
jgi:hypothetical protein